MAINPKSRNMHPADAMKYYSELIMEEREKLEECLRMIAEYSEMLRRVANDTGQRLITHHE